MIFVRQILRIVPFAHFLPIISGRGENMDFMTLVSMPVITAMAMIIVAIISFITGRLNEKYKTNLEYRTFLDIEEILSSYNVGNSPTAKVGTKLLLPLSYKKLLNF